MIVLCVAISYLKTIHRTLCYVPALLRTGRRRKSDLWLNRYQSDGWTSYIISETMSTNKHDHPSQVQSTHVKSSATAGNRTKSKVWHNSPSLLSKYCSIWIMLRNRSSTNRQYPAYDSRFSILSQHQVCKMQGGLPSCRSEVDQIPFSLWSLKSILILTLRLYSRTTSIQLQLKTIYGWHPSTHLISMESFPTLSSSEIWKKVGGRCFFQGL